MKILYPKSTTVWENHFSSLSKSRITGTCEVQALQREIMSLTTASRSHEDYVFDVEFVVEEVSKAISKLPNRKATGPDGVSSELLKFGGSLLRTWITQISVLFVFWSVFHHLSRKLISPLYTKGSS